jgi:thioredoxin 1
MNEVKELNGSTFDAFIAEGVTVIDFWAPWCGPCRAIAPTVEQVAANLKNVKFGKINVDDENSLAMKYGVNSIPNICVFKDGKLVDRSVGFVPQVNLENLIKKYI